LELVSCSEVANLTETRIPVLFTAY